MYSNLSFGPFIGFLLAEALELRARTCDHQDSRHDGQRAHGKPRHGVERAHRGIRAFRKHRHQRDLQRQQRDRRVGQVDVAEALQHGILQPPHLAHVDDGENDFVKGIRGRGDGHDLGVFARPPREDHQRHGGGERQFQHEQRDAAQAYSRSLYSSRRRRSPSARFPAL